MKRRVFLLLLLPLVCVTSCKQKELRKDIADFIANFSLEAAVQAYKVVEMNKVLTVNDGNKITVTNEKISFDVSDINTPQYTHTTEVYENETLIKTSMESLVYENDELYYQVADKKYAYTLEQGHSLIEKFFYTETALDGSYHNGGYYYGDVIAHSCYDYQNQITIDQENNLFIQEGSTTSSSDGVNVKRTSKVIVDKVGMLISNYANAKSQSDDREVTTEITIKNLLHETN